MSNVKSGVDIFFNTPDELRYLIGTDASSVALDPADFEHCFHARLFQNQNGDVRESWMRILAM